MIISPPVLVFSGSPLDVPLALSPLAKGTTHTQCSSKVQTVQNIMNAIDDSTLSRLQDVVTQEHVLTMLRADRGNDAQLISWKIRDFTQNDSSEASFVTSLDIKFSENGKVQNTCYAVRLNPCSQTDLSDDGLILSPKVEESLHVDFFTETTKTVFFSLDEAEKIHIPRPHDLVLQEHVELALATDKGHNVQLRSWETVDITPKGDSHTCYVTTVKVRFSAQGSDQEISYFVKINYSVQKEIKDFSQLMFLKETDFYANIVPELNAQLKRPGMSPLRLPRCLYASKAKGKEVIYLEDLRLRDFKKVDPKRGLDAAHTILVMQELARFHASSVLLQKRYPMVDLANRYELLKVDFSNLKKEHKDYVNNILTWGVESTLVMLRNAGGYEKAVDWITKHKSSVLTIMEDMVKRISSPFDVICHGNCWNNNILFRYNNKGDPTEVMLLDLQRSRLASLATDLNYFLLISLSGDVRQRGLTTFLTKYYEAFKEVLDPVGVTMPFSLQDLHREYKRKRLFGLFFAMGVHPFVMQECTDVPDLEYLHCEVSHEDDHLDTLDQRDLATLDSGCSLRSRFLTIFSELEKEGIFNSSYKSDIIK